MLLQICAGGKSPSSRMASGSPEKEAIKRKSTPETKQKQWVLADSQGGYRSLIVSKEVKHWKILLS